MRNQYDIIKRKAWSNVHYHTSHKVRRWHGTFFALLAICAGTQLSVKKFPLRMTNNTAVWWVLLSVWTSYCKRSRVGGERRGLDAVTSYYVTYCIYISGKPGSVFISIVQFMMSANSRIRFGLQIVFVCLYITPSSLCKLIWRHWIYKMPGRYNLSSVWVRLSIFSQLSNIQYAGRCVFSLPIYFVMVEIIYILCLIIIIKSEVGTITHCLGLGHETMVCAVCLSIFFLKHFAWYKRPCTSQITYKAWFMEDFYRMKHPMTEVIILLADLHFLLSGLFFHEYLILWSSRTLKR